MTQNIFPLLWACHTGLTFGQRQKNGENLQFINYRKANFQQAFICR